MNTKKLLPLLALSAVLFTGCGLRSGEAIIRVNDKNITQAQFDKMFDKQASGGMLSQLGINIKEDKTSFMYLLIKERVINELIVKTLIAREMEKRDITVSKADVDGAIKDIIDKVGSKEQLDAILKQNGVSPADFKKDLEEEVKMKKLADTLGDSKVTDADAEKFYKQNLDKFKFPDKVRASHILISASGEEIAELIKSEPANKNISEADLKTKVAQELSAREAKAKQLLENAKKDPTQFAKMAKENSEDTASAEKGGDLGFFSAQEMVPEFSKAAFSMKPNTVSQNLVKSQYGYHIILVTDRMAAGQEPLEKVKNEIKSYLGNQKQLELLDKLTESLKKTAKIEFLNPDYDPVKMREAVQKSIQEGAEKPKEQAPKK